MEALQANSYLDPLNHLALIIEGWTSIAVTKLLTNAGVTVCNRLTKFLVKRETRFIAHARGWDIRKSCYHRTNFVEEQFKMKTLGFRVIFSICLFPFHDIISFLKSEYVLLMSIWMYDCVKLNISCLWNGFRMLPTM